MSSLAAVAPRPATVTSLTAAICARAAALQSARAVLVGVSGIDGAGKGYVSAQLTAEVSIPRQSRGL